MGNTCRALAFDGDRDTLAVRCRPAKDPTTATVPAEALERVGFVVTNTSTLGVDALRSATAGEKVQPFVAEIVEGTWQLRDTIPVNTGFALTVTWNVALNVGVNGTGCVCGPVTEKSVTSSEAGAVAVCELGEDALMLNEYGVLLAGVVPVGMFTVTLTVPPFMMRKSRGRSSMLTNAGPIVPNGLSSCV